jgi:hypothetical protein
MNKNLNINITMMSIKIKSEFSSPTSGGYRYDCYVCSLFNEKKISLYEYIYARQNGDLSGLSLTNLVDYETRPDKRFSYNMQQ